METSEIRTFMLVAELGSFSRASAKSGVPQPTLSRHIGRLEEDLQGPLFYRHGRGVSLTDIGRQLLNKVTPLVNELDSIRNEIIAKSGNMSGAVRLGIPPSIGRSMAASVVSLFRKRCPGAKLHVMEGFSGHLAEWLEAGTVDIAILYDARRSASMAVHPLLHEELFLVGPPAFLKSNEIVPLASIDTSRLIVPGKGEALRRAIDAAFEAQGLGLDAALEIDSIATMKILAELENLFCILPYGAALREIQDGRLVAAKLSSTMPMSALLVVGTALSRPITMPTQVLHQILKEEVARFVSEGRLRSYNDDC